MPFSVSFSISSGDRARPARADHVRARRLPRLRQAAPGRIRPHHIMRDGERQADNPTASLSGQCVWCVWQSKAKRVSLLYLRDESRFPAVLCIEQRRLCDGRQVFCMALFLMGQNLTGLKISRLLSVPINRLLIALRHESYFASYEYVTVKKKFCFRSDALFLPLLRTLLYAPLVKNENNMLCY